MTSRQPLPGISPSPPRAGLHLPRIGAAASLLYDPTAFFRRARARHGDVFVTEFLGRRLLCVFSAAGVRALWALPEATASKGLADFEMLRHKVPEDLFAGRRTLPHDLFSRDDVAEYERNVELATRDQLDELGAAGETEIFSLARRLGHRVGLASWGGLTDGATRHLDGLVAALDALDSSESFVHPPRALRTWLSGKRRERRALEDLEALYREIIRIRREQPRSRPDLFDRVREAWRDEPDAERGIARDVVLVHMGSMSNLFAANAWTLVHLLARPRLLEAVRAGDDALLERCAHESIRLRQRSIVLRRALRDFDFEPGDRSYRVESGVFLATTMAATNTTALPGLDRFDPDHFEGARFTRREELESPELVTTFGHGRHACPAMRFSITTIRTWIRALLEEYELEPRYSEPRPLRRQIGGVARADRPCRVRYQRRHPIRATA